jgi:hypothetical protein
MATLALEADPSPQKLVVTTVTGDNADLIAEVARLYRLDGLTVADITFGKGNFWPKVDTSRFTLLGTDLFIHPDLRAQRRAQPDQPPLWSPPLPTLCVANFCALPYAAGSINIVVFDPPYNHTPGKTRAINARYRNWETSQGMYHRDILRDFYCRGIQEAARVLTPGGLLWLKGQDEIESGRQCWSHAEVRLAAERCGFLPQDQFFLVTWATQVDDRGQKHARRNHSWLWIFRLAQAAPVAKRGRPKKGSVKVPQAAKRGKAYFEARLRRDYPQIYAR